MEAIIDDIRFEKSSISKSFGGNKDVIAAYLRIVQTDNESSIYYEAKLFLKEDDEMIRRAEETVIQDPYEDEESIRLGTGFGTLDWSPADDAPIEIALYEQDSGEEVWRAEFTERVQEQYEELETERLHDSNKVKARLDDLHERLTDVEDTLEE